MNCPNCGMGTNAFGDSLCGSRGKPTAVCREIARLKAECENLKASVARIDAMNNELFCECEGPKAEVAAKTERVRVLEAGIDLIRADISAEVARKLFNALAGGKEATK